MTPMGPMAGEGDRLAQIKANLAVLQSAPANWYIEGVMPIIEAQRKAAEHIAWLIGEVEALRRESVFGGDHREEIDAVTLDSGVPTVSPEDGQI